MNGWAFVVLINDEWEDLGFLYINRALHTEFQLEMP